MESREQEIMIGDVEEEPDQKGEEVSIFTSGKVNSFFNGYHDAISNLKANNIHQ